MIGASESFGVLFGQRQEPTPETLTYALSVRRWGPVQQPDRLLVKSRLQALNWPGGQQVASLLRLILAPSRRRRNRVDIQKDISALGLVLRILILEQPSRMLSEHAQFKGQATRVCYLYLSPNDFIVISIQKSQF